MFSQFGCCDVLLEITDEERSRGLGMVLVKLSLVRSKFIVVDVVARVGRDLDLTAEKELVVGDLESLLHVLGLFEADEGVAVAGGADDLHPRHFAVLFVLVKEAVFEGGVAAARRQVAHANRQRPTVLRDRGVAAAVRRARRRVAAGRRTAAGTVAATAAAAARPAATARRTAATSRFSSLFLVLPQATVSTTTSFASNSYDCHCNNKSNLYFITIHFNKDLSVNFVLNN